MIESGDVVRHEPTGEERYVLGVNARTGYLCPAGWPHSIAKISDCALVRKGGGLTPGERESRTKMFPGMTWDEDTR